MYKFVTRDSVEERIVQLGRKKLVMDHLIVQKLDVDDIKATEVEDILRFGAKKIFEEDDEGDSGGNTPIGQASSSSTAGHKDVTTRCTYDQHTIEELLDRSKVETESPEKALGVNLFGFTRVWHAGEDTGHGTEADPEKGNASFWEGLLQQRIDLLEAQKLQDSMVLGKRPRRAVNQLCHRY